MKKLKNKVKRLRKIFLPVMMVMLLMLTITANGATGLTVSVKGSTYAKLDWTASAGDVKYRVEYKESSAGTYTTLSSSVTATTFTVSGLKPDTSYDFKVTGIDSGDADALSDTVTATTESGTTSVADLMAYLPDFITLGVLGAILFKVKHI